MGMDVIGLKPTSIAGESYHSSVWYWHPLWDYCVYLWGDLENKVKFAHSNDGSGLNAIDSRKLAFIMDESISSGRAEKYIEQYYQYVSEQPEHLCHCLFKQNLYSSSSLYESLSEIMKSFILNETTASLENNTDSSTNSPDPNCKNCSGSGKIPNFINSYHINLQVIKSFSNFLMHCGGFQIW